jgi:hypothetical protein
MEGRASSAMIGILSWLPLRSKAGQADPLRKFVTARFDVNLMWRHETVTPCWVLWGARRTRYSQ